MRELFFRKKRKFSHIVMLITLALLTILSESRIILGSKDCFLADMFQHYRLFYVFLSLVIFISCLFIKKFKSSIWALLIAIINIFVIASYINLFETESITNPETYKDAPTLSIFYLDMQEKTDASFNDMKVNNQSKKRYKDLIEYIKSGETDLFIFTKIDYSFFDELANIEIYPFRHTNAHIKNSNRTIILSKYPFEKIGYLQTSSKSNELWISYKIGYKQFTLATFSIESFLGCMDCWQDNKAQMNEIAEFAHNSDQPIIAVGNFNAVPWSDLMSSLIERGDLRPKQGLMLTYPWYLPTFLRIPVDHILAQKGIDVIKAKYHKELDIKTKHIPISVVLRPLFEEENNQQ